MHPYPTSAQIAVGLLILFNIWVSISVIRSRFYSIGQKFSQCVIVWIFPLFGLIGIYLFLRSQYNWQKYDTRAYPERSEKFVPIEIDHAIHENLESGSHSSGD